MFHIVEDQLLNKQDLEKVELKLSGDIEKLDAKLSAGMEKLDTKLSAEIKDVRRDVKESELRLFVRLIGAITLISALFKYLPAMHL